MTFQHLLDGAEVLSLSGNPDVSGVEYDSRRVKPGCAFVAMRGETSDGNRFIDQAIQAGAVAVITDSPPEIPRAGVAWALVSHGRRALARVSENFYKRPAEHIAITGITGTNGKSTTAFLIEDILSAAEQKTLLMETSEIPWAGQPNPAPTLHPRLSNWPGFFRRPSTKERATRSWKFHRMPWRNSVFLACPSTWPCLPTSPATTSIITKVWTNILPRSACCSKAVAQMLRA